MTVNGGKCHIIQLMGEKWTFQVSGLNGGSRQALISQNPSSICPWWSARNFSSIQGGSTYSGFVDNNDGMPRIKTAPSAVPTARKPIHYHLLLRPVLQRRFARSSLWTFVVCCLVSFLIGDHYGTRLVVKMLIYIQSCVFCYRGVRHICVGFWFLLHYSLYW